MRARLVVRAAHDLDDETPATHNPATANFVTMCFDRDGAAALELGDEPGPERAGMMFS